jgi:hypothetical protein
MAYGGKRMRRLALRIGAALFVLGVAAAAGATARENRFERSLKMLAPVDRLEQLCDYAAMKQIRKDHRPYRPDRAVAGAAKQPHINDNTIVAKGGAFRSRKKWYELSYTCTAAPDHLSVISFSYNIGAEIPEEKWKSYGLWE